MWRALSVHLMAMTVFVAVAAFIVERIGPALPALNRWIVAAMVAGGLVFWLTLVGIEAVQRVGGRDDVTMRRRRDRAIGLMGNGTSIIGYWLLMPYADDALRLMMVIFQFGPVAVGVLGDVQRPPAPRRPTILPLAMPISTGLYFLVHWDRWSGPVILFLIAYGYVVLTMRRIVQGSMDRTYAARQAAEAALAQVAAERDAKTRFLASASHDLGQPLQAARLFFDQAQRSRTAAGRKAAQDRLRWALDASEQILRQILEHLRLEGGAVEPHLRAVAAGPLIARIAEMNEPAARLAGVELIALPSRLAVRADPALAERALGNLVANAIRHAKARRVLIGARRLAGRVRLWVIDDGVGVAPADAPRLFEDFVQGSDHGDEIRGGFGLGLASARRMAGLMGGAVGLDANWRGGSAFWLELNATEAKTP